MQINTVYTNHANSLNQSKKQENIINQVFSKNLFSSTTFESIYESKVKLPLIYFTGTGETDFYRLRHSIPVELPSIFSEGIKNISIINGEECRISEIKKKQIAEEYGKNPQKAEAELEKFNKYQREIKNEFKNLYEEKFIAVPVKSDGINENTRIPNKVGVMLSGGPAPGGHNVIAGLYKSLKEINKDGEMIGFYKAADGLKNNNKVDITEEKIDEYVNTSSFNMLTTGRDEVKKEDLQNIYENCKKNELDALVIIGGDDSNTNAARLAEFFMEKAKEKGEKPIQVIGIPKTIDGDLKNIYIEQPFGFDTVTKDYANRVSNLIIEADAQKKYWYFAKLMGRSASQVTLEVALQAKPHMAIISETLRRNEKSLDEVIKFIADGIEKRHNNGQDYGVIVIPEGLVEFIPEMENLIGKLTCLIDQETPEYKKSSGSEQNRVQDRLQKVRTTSLLDASERGLFYSLPQKIQEQLLNDRDAHNNFKYSQLDTQYLLIERVKQELANRDKDLAKKFATIEKSFDYDGRGQSPTRFDANYGFTLGYTAMSLIKSGKTGYIAAVQNMAVDTKNWKPIGVPIVGMLTKEKRGKEIVTVIEKALVKRNDPAYRRFKKLYKTEDWLQAKFNPKWIVGPIQYWGPSELVNTRSETLKLNTPTQKLI